MNSDQTVFSAFLAAMALHGRKTRLLEDKNQIEYSYADLLKAAMALGRLGSRLAKKGEMLGVLLPNVATTVNLFLGLNAFGRIPAMLNYTAGVEAVNGACIAAEVRTILSSRAFIEQAELEALIAGLGQYQIVYLEDLRGQFGWLDKLWLILWATRFPSLAAVKTNSEAPAVVLFTSGSEGKPKGVALSHRALLANIVQIRAVIDIAAATSTTGDKFFNALPLFHAFGLTAGTLLPILSGAKLVLYPSPLHYKIIPGLIRKHHCTVLFGTSTFLANYARCADDDDFRSLRFVVAGAERLGDEVRKTWLERFGIGIMEGYGVTEAAPVIAVNTPQDNREGSVGKMLPGMEARIEPVPGIEGGGRLHVRGPNLMSGYLFTDQPGVLQPPGSPFCGIGWHDTGDVVEMEGDGFLFIKGRCKRFAKVAGEMVSLEMAERIAAQAEPNATHAACCIAHAQRGECILLFTTAQGLDRERLLAAARQLGAPEIAVPRRIAAITEIPLLGTGKTDYVALNKMAGEFP
jgi:acyl-[acyl-carrier-protein]-phospholipid O-acyltransferase/long-chain-fatty-acid--[acyl-carrier-protein] ligase